MTSDSYPIDKAAGGARPTNVRFGVLFFLCTLAMLLYIDRVCMGQAAKTIQDEMHLDDFQLAIVHNAFLLAYSLFEVPTGHWADRFGCRGVIARIVLWWSVFTALTGATVGVYSLIGVRFLFGAGEAGAFPNSALVVTKWFPVQSRGKVRGLITTVSMLGGAVGPPLAAYLIAGVGWRWTFSVFGAMGIVWAAAFYWWFRDRPADHPGVNDAERRLIDPAGEHEASPIAARRSSICPKCGEMINGNPAACPLCGEDLTANARDDRLTSRGHDSSPEPPGAADHSIPWSIVLTSPNVWLLGGIMMVSATLFYMQFQWYPKYLEEARSQSLKSSGWLTGAIMLGGAAGCVSGGVLVDAVLKRITNRKLARRLCGGVPLLMSALSTAAVRHVDSAELATLCNVSALFFLQVSMPTWWTIVAEISGRHGASMFGLMNSMGGLGVLGTTGLVGWFVRHRKEQHYPLIDCWAPVFDGVALLLFAGVACWMLVDPTRSIVERPGMAEGVEA